MDETTDRKIPSMADRPSRRMGHGTMKVKGVFRDWEFDNYVATYRKKYCLWIHGGMYGFADHQPVFWRAEPFLKGLSDWQQWRLWRELKRERKRRAIAHVEELADGLEGRNLDPLEGTAESC